MLLFTGSDYLDLHEEGRGELTRVGDTRCCAAGQAFPGGSFGTCWTLKSYLSYWLHGGYLLPLGR